MTVASSMLTVALLLSALVAVVAVAAIAVSRLARTSRHSLPTRHGMLIVDASGIHLVRAGRRHTIYRRDEEGK